ncbi:potassium channel family protein [Humibacter antri]
MTAAGERSTRDSARRARAVQRWQRISTWPFLVLSLVFIVVYSIRCLDPTIPFVERTILATVLGVIWAVFIADYVGRLLLSPQKWPFVRANVTDLLAALLPIFRPFRALRELRRIPFFRQRSGTAVRARVVTYALLFVVLWLYTIAVTEVAAERGAHGATILNLGDAIYWAVVTMATVGYGDMVPVTTLGRVLAIMLMLSGIVIVGVTTATVVSYFNDTIRRHAPGGEDREGADGESIDREGAEPEPIDRQKGPGRQDEA